MTERPAAPVLGHETVSVVFNGETWQIVCACMWECWDVQDEEEAWEAFNDHVFDDVKTAVARLRDKATVARV